MNRTLRLFPAALLFFVAACQSNANDLTPATVSFQKDVHPIFLAHCTPCHQGQADSTGHLGDGPLPFVDDYARSQVLIETIINRVELPESSFHFMPRGGQKLTAHDIQVLKDWLAQGEPK